MIDRSVSLSHGVYLHGKRKLKIPEALKRPLNEIGTQTC
jgi:hypothetical protein